MTHSEYENDPQTPAAGGERLRVARIGKPHGIRGEVTVQLFTDEPAERLAPGQRLLREPGSDTAERRISTLTVSRQRWNKNICLLGFDEVADRNAAESLRGSVLFVDVPAVVDDEEGWYSHELEGLACVDLSSDRDYGTVAELITGAAQDLLVVRAPSGGQIMVPFVKEIVPTVDPEAGRIILTPPAGLFPDEGDR